LEELIMLRRGLASVVVLAAVLWTCGPAPVSAAVDATQLTAGEFEGTLKRVPGTDRLFTVTVSVPSLSVNPNAVRNLVALGLNNAHIQRQYQHVLQLEQQVATSKHPAQKMVQLQNAIIALQSSLANLRGAALVNQAHAVKVHTVTQDIVFQAAEDVKVRTLSLPEAFDEKGKVRKHTAEELKAAKGKDTNLPGYESSLEALAHGQVIKVTLVPRRTSKAGTTEKNTKPDGNKDKDDDAAEKKGGKKGAAPGIEDSEKKMQVKMIVIISGGTASKADSPGGSAPKP
jgi:hypothetical protein